MIKPLDVWAMWLDGYIAVTSCRVTRTEVAQAHELYLQNMFTALFIIIIGFIYTIHFPHI
jgi:hypothetical protein